jgi:DNA-binding NarL/FixJ family response regulator
MSIRVLVADDHEVVRKGLKSLVRGTDIKIVGEARTGEETLRLARTLNSHVVVLDVQMPDKDGIWTLAKLKADRPNLPVLMFSAFDNPAYVARAVATGANGYIIKSATRDELIQAVRAAAAGENTWTREVLRRVAGALATPRQAADVEVSLTQRENEVLKLLAQGATNNEIARSLGIGFETVKDHVQNIFRKIGATDRTQAAIWAVRKGLI